MKMRKINLILTVLTNLFLIIILIMLWSTTEIVRFTPRKIDIPIIHEETLDVPVMLFSAAEADALIEQIKAERAKAEREAAEKRSRSVTYSSSAFRRLGVLHWGGRRWTWYSERVLPGYGLRIPGRHTDEQGYVRDGDGYIVVGTDDLRKGTVIDTPLGSQGKVYDCGSGSTIDVYVGW